MNDRIQLVSFVLTMLLKEKLNEPAGDQSHGEKNSSCEGRSIPVKSRYKALR
jgi:hypothetical protein